MCLILWSSELPLWTSDSEVDQISTYLTIWYHTIVNLLYKNLIVEYLVNIWWPSDQFLMSNTAGSMLVKKDLAPQMLNTCSSLHVTTFLIRPKLSLYFLESFLCHMQTFFSYNSLFSFSHQCLHQHKKFKIVFFFIFMILFPVRWRKIHGKLYY